MIYNVLMISEQRLKDYTPINENVDTSELRFSIQMAQNIFVQESLGTNLFNHMLTLISGGTMNQPANENYKLLLDDFIAPMLTQYAFYLALDNFFVKFVNVGLQSFRSEQSNPIGLKEFQYMKNNAKNQAEFLDNLLRRHLVFRNNLYPEYTLTTNNGQLIPEFAGAFKSPLTLPANTRIGSRYGVFGNSVYGCPYPWWYGGPSILAVY
jgi:hypothetical protein